MNRQVSMTQEQYAQWEQFAQNLEQRQPQIEMSRDKVIAYITDRSDFFKEEKDIFHILDTPDDGMNLIVGDVQSGKTAVICGLACYNILVKKESVVIIVRNLVGDYEQLATKFSTGPFKDANIPIIYTGTKDIKLDLNRALRNVKPSLIIAIANATQLGAVNTSLDEIEKDHEESNFSLYVDECDMLAVKKDGDKPYMTQFANLYARCNQVFGITATPMDNLLLNQSLVSKNIFKLSRPLNYKGIEDIEFKTINTMDLKLDSKTSTLPQGMTSLFQDFQDEDEYESKDGKIHPKIVLLRISTLKAEHEQLVRRFATSIELSDIWTAISFNGEGAWIYNSKMKGLRNVMIEGVKGVRVGKYGFAGLGIWSFKKISIGAVLQYLRDLDQEEFVLGHIVIASGLLASRGINFVSNGDYKWHLTHQILCSSVKSTTSDLIQSARLCGRYDDDIQLKLYTSQTDINDFHKALKTTEVLIDGCIQNEEKYAMDSVEKIPIFSDLLPKRKMSKKRYYCLNEKQRDGGMEGYNTRLVEEKWCVDTMLRNFKKARMNGQNTYLVQIIEKMWNPLTRDFDEISEADMNLIGASSFDFTRWSKSGSRYTLLVEINKSKIYAINPEVKLMVQDLLQ